MMNVRSFLSPLSVAQTVTLLTSIREPIHRLGTRVLVILLRMSQQLL